MKKHILVVSQYFFPEQFRINDICEEWVKRGYEVTVITGVPNYPDGEYYKGYGLFKKRVEVHKGIKIIRLPIIPRKTNSIFLALNYISFVISGFIWSMTTKTKADYVFNFEVSPMTQALVGIWFSKRRKIPFYIYVQDLWPENFVILSGIKNKIIIKYIGKMVDYIYKNSNKIFTTSNSFIKAISARGVPHDRLEFWPQFAEDHYIPLEKENVKTAIDIDGENFNLIFAGNIGFSQGLDVLPKAAKYIKENFRGKKIVFNIIGDGRYKEKLLKEVREFEVENYFNFINRIPSKEVPAYLAKADIALLTLSSSEIFSMTIPAKLQTYLACGKPIVASVEGETLDIINTNNLGLASISGDWICLAQNIIEVAKLPKDKVVEMSYNSRDFYLKNYSKDFLMNSIERYFKE